MGNKEQDISQRLTEMLDEQRGGQDKPSQEVVVTGPAGKQQTLQELEQGLTADYQRVQNGTLRDPELIRELAGKFLAIANDPQLRRQVNFNADRASDVLFDLIGGQKRESVEEVWHYRIVRYR